MKRLPVLILLAGLMASVVVHAQNPYLATDPPRDNAFPASIVTFQLPTHGTLVNALAYIAAGRGPHPTIILLHGFPGNERNLDLAQAVRRTGWNVLFFNYRGSWGSPGYFSFTHCIEDAQAALAWLREPANSARLRTDPASLVLIGHSMGGFVALETAARDSAVSAIIVISAADLSRAFTRDLPTATQAQRVSVTAARLEAEGMAPLAGTTSRALAEEIAANSGQWSFDILAPKLASRPVFAVTSDDGLTVEVAELIQLLQKAGNTQAREVHMTTDHSYSDHRIALAEAVLANLRQINQAAAH